MTETLFVSNHYRTLSVATNCIHIQSKSRVKLKNYRCQCIRFPKELREKSYVCVKQLSSQFSLYT